MAKKTNKTSHVLNLITNGNPPEPEAADSQAASPEQKVAGGGMGAATGVSGEGTASEPVPAKNPPVSSAPASEKKVIVVDDSETNKLSDEIRDQLISHLEAEEKQEQSAQAVEPQSTQEPAAPAAAEPTVQPEPEPVQEPAAPVAAEPTVQSEPEPVAEPQPVQESVAPAVAEPTVQPQSEPAQPEPKPMPKYRMVNVMEEILKRQKLEQHMARYDVCMCSRCRADVEALTLTKLPAKYVVVDESSVAPIIGFYENRYKVNILTQIIKACMQVKEEPHHKEGEY